MRISIILGAVLFCLISTEISAYNPLTCAAMYGLGTPDYQECIASHERGVAQRRKKEEYQKLHRADIEKAEQAARDSYSAQQRARAARPGVALGMTPQQVEEETNWAYPDRRNRTVTASGTVEQWAYSTAPHIGDYLYFRDGVLFAIQERNPR